MTIQEMILQCDCCGVATDEHIDLEEAFEFGWYVLRGPERDLGPKGEHVFCSRDCLVSYA